MDLESIRRRIEAALPEVRLEVLPNPSPSAQNSLLVHRDDALEVAFFLRDKLGFDYCSNVTGIDWPQREISEKVKVNREVGGVAKEVEEVRKSVAGGFLETVYHLYAREHLYACETRSEPLPLRVRTLDRAENVDLPSLTPVWRSAELQEREAYDLFGIRFAAHPDLRRLLMWEGFADFPMRRDYVEPDDYEYEPTAHDEVLNRSSARRAEAAH